jgi:hypothetical protein
MAEQGVAGFEGIAKESDLLEKVAGQNRAAPGNPQDERFRSEKAVPVSNP